MKKITINILIALAIIISATSCNRDRSWVKGKGPSANNTRNISGFNGVDLSISANVEIYYDSVFRVELYGQQNILNVINTEVRGGKLLIGLDWGTTIRKHDPILVKLYMPTLNSVNVSGSGSILCHNDMFCDNLDARISGSGGITLHCSIANTLTAHISGSGDMFINNSIPCLNAKYSISGSGSINAEWVRADYVEANISGSGDQTIYAVKELDARISGSGNINYRGNPAVKVSISGSGKVRSIQ